MLTGLFATGFTVEPYLEHAQQEMVWNIAGNEQGQSPNILSELTYKDLSGLGAGIRVSQMFMMKDKFAVYVDGRFGVVDYDQGRHQDSDYLEDNRQLEFSRSTGSSKESSDKVFALETGFKMPWGLSSNHLWRLGFGVEKLQHDYLMTQGVQVVNMFGDELGAFEGLHASYDAERIGMTLGFGTEHRIGLWRFAGQLQLGYHDYDATANWNLRNDFDHPNSYEHKGISKSTTFELKVYRELVVGALSIGYRYESHGLRNGYDHIHFADGTGYVTRLNEVEMTRSGLTAGYSLTF